MELDNHHLLVTMQANYMGEASAPFAGSMMALMTEEQEKAAEGGRVHHLQSGPANFMYYNAVPPLQEYVNPASLFQLGFHNHSHRAPEQSYDLLIQHRKPAQEQQHDQAPASTIDHEGKCELLSRNIKPELQLDHVNSTRTYSQPSSLSHETRASPTSLDMESSCGKTASDTDTIKDKIIAHPNYHRLVIAYMNCHKVGAPPDVARRLDELSRDYENLQPLRTSNAMEPADPELDQFMETYCHVLNQYHEDLTRPFKEAMEFLQKVELQINNISKGHQRFSQLADGSSGPVDEQEELEEEQQEEEGGSCGEVDYEMDAVLDPHAEDKQLRDQLLSKYRGYICTLKQEFMKKKKKGKLPKDGRQRLLEWWNEHCKWPYPSETEKASLAESTGLDQKQINNWFINQRKRHWKPSEDMRYVMVNDQEGLDKDHQDFYSYNNT